MKKGIIICAFATCGKTYLSKKYKNVIDLESSDYRYKNTDATSNLKEQAKGTKRDINPEWPQNYYDAIELAQKKYDIVLVQLKPEHFDYFDKNKIKYTIVYPNTNNFAEIEKRCKERKNNTQFINKLKQVFIPFFIDSKNREYENFYILNDNMTLEDILLKNNYNLIKK